MSETTSADELRGFRDAMAGLCFPRPHESSEWRTGFDRGIAQRRRQNEAAFSEVDIIQARKERLRKAEVQEAVVWHLCLKGCISEPAARSVLSAILAGSIPHLKIEY